MKIISHRGNLSGPSTTENTKKSILQAVQNGFEVEIDVWLRAGQICLGHDKPADIQYNNLEFIISHSSVLWIHCKNMEALYTLSQHPALNCFGHSNDDFVLTSKKNLFFKPGILPTNRGVMVMPELSPVFTVKEILNSYTILTDYPIELKESKFQRFTK